MATFVEGSPTISEHRSKNRARKELCVVTCGSPAPALNATARLDQPREMRPSLRIERFGFVSAHEGSQ